MVIDGIKAGGPLVIDNISSRENCEAVAAQLYQTYNYDNRSTSYRADTHRCITVRKAK